MAIFYEPGQLREVFLYCFLIAYTTVLSLWQKENWVNKQTLDLEIIDSFYKEPAMSNICLRSNPSTRKGFNYLFFYEQHLYKIQKKWFGFTAYPSANSKQQYEILADFQRQKCFLESKNIYGISIPFDSIITLNLSAFKSTCLYEIDSSKTFKQYRNINMTKADITYSFVHHEYYSQLFHANDWFFYYSNE